MTKMPTRQAIKRRQKLVSDRIAHAILAQSGDGFFMTAAAPIDFGTDENHVPSVSIEAYTGGELRLPNFKYPVVVDLSSARFRNDGQTALLKDHDQKSVVGHSTSQEITAKGIYLNGLVSGGGEAAAEVIKAAKNGFEWEASIGAQEFTLEVVPRGRTLQANGRTFTGPLLYAKNAVIYEVSFVAVGADKGRATARVAAASGTTEDLGMGFHQWLQSIGLQASALDAKTLKSMQTAYANEISGGNGLLEVINAAIAGRETETIDRAAVLDQVGGVDRGSLDRILEGEANVVQRDGLTRISAALELNADDVITAAGQAGWNLPAPTPQNPTLPTPPTPPGDGMQQRRAAEARERERITAIDELCASAGNPSLNIDGANVLLASQAIEQGWNTDRVELEIHRNTRPSVPAIHASGTDGATHGQAIEAALCIRASMPEAWVGERFDQRTMNAAVSRDYRTYGLHTLMHDTIRAAGMSHRAGLVNNDFVRTALEADVALENQGRLQAAGGFTTFTLSGILGAVAYKRLMMSYEAVPTVWQHFCAPADNSNFHTHTRYRLSGDGQFLKISGTGELKHGNLDESSYTSAIDTHGRIFTLTRKDMINDDLQAFLAIPIILGQGAATAQEEAFVKLVLAATGITSIVAPLTVAGMDTAEKSIMENTDTKTKKPILSVMNRILVPPALRGAGNRLFQHEWLNQVPAANAAATAQNIHVGKFEPYTTPYLGVNTGIRDEKGKAFTGASDTTWYAGTDPAVLAAFEMAFLQGNRTPQVEQADADFRVLGRHFRGFFDFGVSYRDPKGLRKCTAS